MKTFEIHCEVPHHVFIDFGIEINTDRRSLRVLLRGAKRIRKVHYMYGFHPCSFTKVSYDQKRMCHLISISMDQSIIEYLYPDFFKDFSTKLWADVRFGTITNELYEREVRGEKEKN